jgi:hypothetical protein
MVRAAMPLLYEAAVYDNPSSVTTSMTAQVFDRVIFEGESYKLSLATSELPFKAELFNIEPVWTSTSCWRGFLRTFIIENQQLLIKQLDVNDKKTRELGLAEYQPNTIYGIYPEINNAREIDTLFEMTYKELNHVINFTGSLLIGKNFYLDFLDHTCDTNWQHREVYELTFEKGNLLSSLDMADTLNEVGLSLNKLRISRTNWKDLHLWLRTTCLEKYFMGDI